MASHPRDVDLLIAVEPSGLDPVLDVLRANGCRPKKSPPMITVGEHHFVQLLYTPQGEFYEIQLDLLLAESELQKSAIARRVEATVPGVEGVEFLGDVARAEQAMEPQLERPLRS